MSNIFASKVDYCELLLKATKNKRKSLELNSPCYITTFSPPKKMKPCTVSPDNIKKFFNRREEEERRKNEAAQKKRSELMALRNLDKKAVKRVQTMLKTTKSANKSVMADAIDNVNTADTLNGFRQCDEDDYGFVSQEASDFYNKMLKKYEEIDSYNNNTNQETSASNALNEQLKSDVKSESFVALKPHISLRPISVESIDSKNHSLLTGKDPNHVVSVKKKKYSSPPVKFDTLMKIAEKKQFEPIQINIAQHKEPEKLMTEKEKMEYEEEQRMKQKKRKLLLSTKKLSENNKQKLTPKRISEDKNALPSEKSISVGDIVHKDNESCVQKHNNPSKIALTLKPTLSLNGISTLKKSKAKIISNDKSIKKSRDHDIYKIKKENKLLMEMLRKQESKIESLSRQVFKVKARETHRNKTRHIQCSRKQQINSDLEKHSDSADEADYSKHIRDIFHYDKSKYADIHNEKCIESNFKDIQKEEFLSAKIGLLEDLEDIREKKKKKLSKNNLF